MYNLSSQALLIYTQKMQKIETLSFYKWGQHRSKRIIQCTLNFTIFETSPLLCYFIQNSTMLLIFHIYIYIIFSSLHSKSRKRPKAGSFSKLPNAWILANLFLNIAVLLNENKNNGECWSVKYKK